jgi:ABC-type nitrate/sulfonate/bicarbonate transport system ATPase subunit
MQTEAEAPAKEPLSYQDIGVALRGVRRSFRELTALEGLDLDLRPRELLAVVGPSGCGKSTLLELVAGLQQPDAGSVVAGGAADPARRRAACAYMPQRDLLLPWRDALGNAALALECQGVKRAEARRRAEPFFERFGLARFERTRPAELSGGMRQRVAFLRTLLPGRPVLLLDEPFGALDAITRASMQEWLAGALVQEPRTTLLVTHDVEEAVFLADRVAVMSPRPGRIVATLDVDLPRPRRLTDPRVVELRQAALEALGG